MTCSFSLSIFRFNAKTDYLPYYKKHTLSLPLENSLRDLLALAKADDPLFDYPQHQYAGAKINGVALLLDTPLSAIKERFGSELVIDALSNYRATKDLIIDTQDFMARFDLLAPYVEKTDKTFFESLVCLHYGSQTLTYDRDFQGSALFVFANEMIVKYPQFRTQILAIIADETTGIWFHTPLTYTVFPEPASAEASIGFLKEEVLAIDPALNETASKVKQGLKLFTPTNTAPFETMKALQEYLGLGQEADLKAIARGLSNLSPKHPFHAFKTAIYLGNTKDEAALREIVHFCAAKEAPLSKARLHSGVSLYPFNPTLACTMAADILLEAYDAGCDFVIVNDPKDFELFETRQKELTKAVGRPVEIPVLTPSQLVLLALGEFSKTAVDTHTCKPTFID